MGKSSKYRGPDWISFFAGRPKKINGTHCFSSTVWKTHPLAQLAPELLADAEGHRLPESVEWICRSFATAVYDDRNWMSAAILFRLLESSLAVLLARGLAGGSGRSSNIVERLVDLIADGDDAVASEILESRTSLRGVGEDRLHTPDVMVIDDPGGHGDPQKSSEWIEETCRRREATP